MSNAVPPRLACFRTDAVLHHMQPQAEQSMPGFLHDRWRWLLSLAVLVMAGVVAASWVRTIPVVVSGLAVVATCEGGDECTALDLDLLMPGDAKLFQSDQPFTCEVDGGLPLTGYLGEIHTAPADLAAAARRYRLAARTEFPDDQVFTRVSAHLDPPSDDRLDRLARIGGCRARVTIGDQSLAAVVPHLLRSI
jgi:hypothetical protein